MNYLLHVEAAAFDVCHVNQQPQRGSQQLKLRCRYPLCMLLFSNGLVIKT